MKRLGERQLPEILRNDMVREGFPLKKGIDMAPTPKSDESAMQLPRVSIDLKIPLWGLMSVAGIAAVFLATTYFQLMRVADDVTELKSAIKSSNVQTIQFAQEQALIKFRVEKLEQEKAR